VARITLDRPPLNVLTTSMLRQLAEAVDRSSSSPDVRVIRLDAEGERFSAGVDVRDHLGDALEPMMQALLAVFEALERTELPTVSVVQGAALGGGCELALGTDLCLASDRASFGQPEIKLGVFAPPASVLLPWLVGERRALQLLLTGETIAAEEAKRIGIVNEVFPAHRFAEAAAQWIGRIADLSGAALRFAKRAVREARRAPTSDAHRELVRTYLAELMATADANEGLRAFLEKRAPVWKHA
jgi:cyclohexa-1,5-dienecarbonyl-CoA hydratase